MPRALPFILCLLLPVALVRAKPVELTAPQKQQLASARDRSRMLDEGALYPLLENAGWLKLEDKTDAVELKPEDIPALLADPAAHRGKLFHLTGYLAGKPRTVTGEAALARPGPWSDRLEQWNIQFDREKPLAVVVFLVDPPTPYDWPLRGQQVELVARFFKVWSQPAVLDGKNMDFLVFVGKTARVVKAEATPGEGPSARQFFFLASGAVLLMIMLWTVARMIANKRTQHAQRRFAQEHQLREAQRNLIRQQMDDSPPLPQDPEAALRELERRNQP